MTDTSVPDEQARLTEAEREALYELRGEMMRLSGVEPRLEYLRQLGDERAVAVAQEWVRLSRLADYEDPDIDGRRWASATHAVIAKRLVEAILAGVFQGQKDYLRDHMLGVAAKVDRQLVMEPWWEAHLAARLAARPVSAGPDEEGLRAGVDETSRVEYAVRLGDGDIEECGDDYEIARLGIEGCRESVASGDYEADDYPEPMTVVQRTITTTVTPWAPVGATTEPGGRQGDGTARSGPQEPLSGPRSDEQGSGDGLDDHNQEDA